MSTKTWREEFDDEFLQQSYCGSPECEYEGNDKCFHGTENSIKQFISDLRKKDEEELIKMLSLKIYSNPDNYGCVYNESLENSIKLVKEYYAK